MQSGVINKFFLLSLSLLQNCIFHEIRVVSFSFCKTFTFINKLFFLSPYDTYNCSSPMYYGFSLPFIFTFETFISFSLLLYFTHINQPTTTGRLMILVTFISRSCWTQFQSHFMIKHSIWAKNAYIRRVKIFVNELSGYINAGKRQILL